MNSNKNRQAFTMIELVFVIVVLGILAAIAVPKLAATRDDAHIVKGRADILAIRSGIITERQARMFRGDSSYTASLNTATGLFGKVLTQPITAKAATVNGGWRQGATGSKYIFHVINTDVNFDYNSTTGTFTCTPGTYCSKLTD